VTVPDSPQLDGAQVSVEAWVDLLGPSASSDSTIVQKYDAYGNPVDGWDLEIGNGDVTFNGYGEVYSVSAPVQQGVWTYVVGTYDASQMSLYINGVLAASEAVHRFAASSTPLVIGGTVPADALGGDRNFADVAVYNTILTPAQILAHYQVVQWTGTLIDRGTTATGNDAIVLSGAQNVTIADMTIQDAYTGIDAEDSSNSTGLTVENVEVRSCAAGGIYAGPTDDNVYILQDDVHGVSSGAPPDSPYGAIDDRASGTVVGNISFGNTTFGLQLLNGNHLVTGNLVFDNVNGGINAPSGGFDVIEGNEVYRNGGSGTNTAGIVKLPPQQNSWVNFGSGRAPRV
jgi:hypothetical protein